MPVAIDKTASTPLHELSPQPVQEKQVKILTDEPFESGLFSYGKALSSIVYAFFSFLVPVLCAVFTSFRSHVVEMINLKGDLAQNKFDILQQCLEKPEFEQIVDFADRSDLKGFQEYMKKSAPSGYDDPRVKALADSIFMPTLFGDVKKQALEIVESDKDLKDAVAAISVDDPDLFVKCAIHAAEGSPSVQKELKQLGLAVSVCEDKQENEKVQQMKEVLFTKGWTEESLQETLDALVSQGYKYKAVEKFLLDKKTFGNNRNSPVFQAGFFLLMHQLKPVRDQQLTVNFYRLVQNLRNSSDEDQLGYNVGFQIRDLAYLASLSPLYQKMQRQQGSLNPFVFLIQDLCTTLHMKIPGIRELRELGSMYMHKVEKKHGPVEKEGQKMIYLAKALDTALEKHKKYSFEPFKDRVLTDKGNFDIGVGSFCLGDRVIQSAFGPKYKSDRAIEHHLDALIENGGIHLHQELTNSPKGLGNLEQKYPSVVRVFSMPLDGVTRKMTGEKRNYFLDFSSSREFLMKYAKFALRNQTAEDSSDQVQNFYEIEGEDHLHYSKKDDNGFYFSRNVLNPTQFRLAFDCAAQAFSHVNPEIEGHARVAEAMQLGVQGFLTVGAIVKTLQDLPVDKRDDYLNATYKQTFERDIDRGIVMNVLTEVYFRMLSSKPVDEEFIKEMIGTVIARAELIVGHKVTLSDYQTLSDLLRIIGADEGRVGSALNQYVKVGFGVDEASSCRFEPFVAKAPDRDKRTKITTEKEIFEGRKKHPPLKNKGSYGSVIYFDRQGKPYGIFKSIDARFPMDKKVKSKALNMIWITGQEGYLPLPQMRQVGAMISERATYLLDRVLRIDLVPKTEIIYAQGHKGSFQHFVHGYKEAQEVTLPSLDEIHEKDLDKFQRFAIVDYLLGNLDRKADNWMVKMSKDSKRIQDIKVIDNANCFPKGHLPQSWSFNGSTWSQYAWKTLDLSRANLSKESIRFISKLSDDKILRMIDSWKQDLGPEYFESFFGGEDGEAIKAFKDRARVLRKLAEEAKTSSRSLVDLAKYGTYEAIHGYLGKTEASQATYILPTYA